MSKATPLSSPPKPKKHYFESDYPKEPEPEDWPFYECVLCGITDDEDEIRGIGSGIVFPSGSNEPTALETFLCSSCKRFFPKYKGFNIEND